jgi:TatA/E family protein of Tat protein translocase
MPFVGALEPPHLILILVIVLVIFGPGKLPQLGKSLGDGIREFKKSVDNPAEATTTDAPPAPAEAAAPQQLAAGTVRCGNCGLAAPVGTKFCSGCGTTLTSSSAGPETAKEAVTH